MELESRRTWLAGSGWVLASQIVGAVSALGVTVLVGRMGGPRSLGLYVAITAAATLGVALGTFALEAHVMAGLRGESSDEVVVASAMRTAYSIILPLAFLSSVVLLIAAQTGAVHPVALLAIVEILISPLMFARPYLHARGLQRSIASAAICGRLVWLSLASGMIIAFPASAVASAVGFRFAGSLLEATLLGRASGASIARYLGLASRRQEEALSVPSTLRQTTPLGISGAATAMNQRLDVLLLTGLLGTGAAGMYGAATRLAEPFRMVGSSLYQVIGPALIRATAFGDSIRVTAIARDFALLLAATTGLGATLLTAVSPWLLPGLFGQEFAPAVPLVPIMVLAEVGLLVGLISTGLALAMDRRSSIAWATSVAAVANLALNALLVPAYGVFGAAVASLVSYSISGFAVLLLDPQIREVGFPALRICAAGVALTTLAVYLPDLLGMSRLTSPLLLSAGWLLIFRRDVARARRVVLHWARRSR